MKPTRLQTGCAVAALMGWSLSAHALELYTDNTVTNGGHHLGATQLFYVGPVGAPGAWGIGSITVDGNSIDETTCPYGTPTCTASRCSMMAPSPTFG